MGANDHKGMANSDLLKGMVCRIYVGPKLKFYLFPLTRPTLKKGPTTNILLQFSGKIFFNFFSNLENCRM